MKKRAFREEKQLWNLNKMKKRSGETIRGKEVWEIKKQEGGKYPKGWAVWFAARFVGTHGTSTPCPTAHKVRRRQSADILQCTGDIVAA